MVARRMHADEVESDVALVRRLLAAQFPEWAELAVEPVASGGTDNAIYRLGPAMAVRLPRLARVVMQVEKELEWLPRLAPHLPLAIPVPLARGEPGEGYPLPWAIHPWLEGANATLGRLADPVAAARDLAAFVRALQRVPVEGAPRPGEHNVWRGIPLARRDRFTRAAIARSEGLVDQGAVTAAWEADVRAPAWEGPPVWIHGDLQPGNLLAAGGRLHGVIDWGALGVGDPACDLLPAWNLFSGASRDAFRAALGVDHATWARGRGWALSVAMVGLPYYIETNPVFVRSARQMIDAVLADHAHTR